MVGEFDPNTSTQINSYSEVKGLTSNSVGLYVDDEVNRVLWADYTTGALYVSDIDFSKSKIVNSIILLNHTLPIWCVAFDKRQGMIYFKANVDRNANSRYSLFQGSFNFSTTQSAIKDLQNITFGNLADARPGFTIGIKN